MPRCQPACPPSSQEHRPQQIPVNAPCVAPSSDVCVAQSTPLFGMHVVFGSCSRSQRGRGGWGASPALVGGLCPVCAPAFPPSREALLGAAAPTRAFVPSLLWFDWWPAVTQPDRVGPLTQGTQKPLTAGLGSLRSFS